MIEKEHGSLERWSLTKEFSQQYLIEKENGSLERWSLTKEFLQQYLIEKENGSSERWSLTGGGRLLEVVATRELTV